MKTLFTLTVALLLTVTASTFAQTRIMDAKLLQTGELSVYMTATDSITAVIVQVGAESGDSGIYNAAFSLADFTVTADHVLEKNIGSLPAGSYALITITLSSGESKEIEIPVRS